MNLRSPLAPVLAALVLLSAFHSGCNRSAADHAHAPHQAHPPAATYKEGHGLQLSERGARFIGLQIADVDTRALGRSGNVPAIPARALLRTAKGEFVYVANGDWLLRTPIKLGAAADGWLEVTEGLYEGDKIVVGGTQALWLAEVHAVNGGVGCAHGH